MVGGVFIVSNTDISVCATSEGSPVYKQEALTTYYSDSDLRNIANSGDHQWLIQEFHNPGAQSRRGTISGCVGSVLMLVHRYIFYFCS